MLKPSLWESAGCSYRYNSGFYNCNLVWDQTMTPTNGASLGGRKVSWVTEPSRYILMYEPPARRDSTCFYHWHFRRRPSDIGPCDNGYEPLRQDKQRFISPILFVDGHVARTDFTKSIQANPQYCCEPTQDWMWYQPEPESK